MLTKRQTVLFDRLVTLGEWATAAKLPVDVTEILGFGSFFRGKANPKDVDLLIRHSGSRSRHFESFLRLLRLVRSDVTFQSRFERPLDSFLEVFNQSHLGMFPGLLNFSEERAIFAMWLEPYSWSMLFPSSIAEQVSWDDPAKFTGRLTRKHFPGLNIFHYLAPAAKPAEVGMVAGHFVTIWSHKRPDVRANLLEQLRPGNVRKAVRAELDNFDRQCFRLRANFDIFKRMIEQLRSSQRSKERNELSYQWLRRWYEAHDGDPVSKSAMELLESDGWLLNRDEIRKELRIEFAQPSYREISADGLSELVETRRDEVKNLWELLEAAREVFYTLAKYKANCILTQQSAYEFLASTVLSTAKPKQQTAIQSVLSVIQATSTPGLSVRHSDKQAF